MLRAILLAMLVSIAAADLASECMKALQLLDGENDFELAARCRASFGPEVCKQARQSLGAQPWTQARMQGSCAHFASAYEGMDSRALEEAVSNKPTGPVDGSTQGKTGAAASTSAAPTTKPQPQGPLVSLLNKLKEGKAVTDDSAKKAQEAMESGADNSEATEASRQKMKEGTEAKESAAEANKQKDEQVKKKEEAKPEVKAAEEQPSGPLAKMLAKMEEAKAAKQGAQQNKKDESDPSAGSVDKLKKVTAPAAVKLYGDAQMQKPTSSETMSPALGAMLCAASMVAITMFVASRRARTLPSDHYHLNVQPDLEQTVE